MRIQLLAKGQDLKLPTNACLLYKSAYKCKQFMFVSVHRIILIG